MHSPGQVDTPRVFVRIELTELTGNSKETHRRDWLKANNAVLACYGSGLLTQGMFARQFTDCLVNIAVNYKIIHNLALVPISTYVAQTGSDVIMCVTPADISNRLIANYIIIPTKLVNYAHRRA